MARVRLTDRGITVLVLLGYNLTLLAAAVLGQTLL